MVIGWQSQDVLLLPEILRVNTILSSASCSIEVLTTSQQRNETQRKGPGRLLLPSSTELTMASDPIDVSNLAGSTLHPHLFRDPRRRVENNTGAEDIARKKMVFAVFVTQDWMHKEPPISQLGQVALHLLFRMSG